jgi:hypothetical protein
MRCFLAALLHTLFAEDLARPGTAGRFTTGLDEVAQPSAAFTPELAERAHCGIDAAQSGASPGSSPPPSAAICYGRMGVSTQRFGALCQWLIQIINIATGNLDREGGSLFTLPAVDQVPRTGPGGFRPPPQPGARICRSSIASCPRRRWPRRSPHPAKGRFARCSPARAIRCSPRPTAGPWMRRRPAGFHGVPRSLHQRDHAPRAYHPAADLAPGARSLRHRLSTSTRCATPRVTIRRSSTPDGRQAARLGDLHGPR